MCKRHIYLVSVIFVLCFVGASLADVSNSNLIGWWLLNEGSGTIAFDSSGHENHGTIYNSDAGLGPDGSVWDIDPDRGTVISFNGDDTGGAYVSAGHIPAMTLDNDFTWAFWCKQHSEQTDLYDVIIGNRFGGTEEPLQFIKFTPQEFEYYHRGGSPEGENDVGTMDIEDLPADVWIHQAVVKDGATLTYYRDSLIANTTTVTNTIDENPFYMGGDAHVSDDFHERWRGWLSDVRIYNRALTQAEVLEIVLGKPPTFSYGPNPANGATELPRDVVLNWKAGITAQKHDVYLGTTFNDVNDANRESGPNSVLISQNQEETTYDPNGLLDFNTTYYWRVDEINDADPNSPWKGEVWNFTTRNYIVVDDFEDYNDIEPDRIFDTWVDGWGIATNGAQVGYDTIPYAEQTTVHGGSQSMPLSYNNTEGVAYSEAVRTFDEPQDWIIDGAETLTLFFRGYPQAFVEDPPGTYTMGASGADVWDESDEFRYAYKVLSGNGSISARVVSVENTNSFAKAGVMIRKTLDPFSAHGFMFITPNRRRAFQNRPTDARESYSAHSDPNSISLPGWVRIERNSIFITAYYSEDGVNWIQQPTDENTGNDASPNPRIIVMGADTYIGLAYCSHNANMTGTAVFADVTTTGTVTGEGWEVATIGVEMNDNDTQPLYVALQDGGTIKAVEHPNNPYAVLENDWRQWDVPLNIFSDAGVDLTAVEKVTIGVGSRTDTQDGQGKLCFDNIRLYRPTPSEPNEASDPNATTEQ
jgi:hypothetical protein